MVSLWHHSMRFSLRNKGGVLERSGLTGDSVNMLLLNEMRILEESLRSLRGITARDQGIRGIIFVFSDGVIDRPWVSFWNTTYGHGGS